MHPEIRYLDVSRCTEADAFLPLIRQLLPGLLRLAIRNKQLASTPEFFTAIGKDLPDLEHLDLTDSTLRKGVVMLNLTPAIEYLRYHTQHLRVFSAAQSSES